MGTFETRRSNGFLAGLAGCFQRMKSGKTDLWLARNEGMYPLYQSLHNPLL